jgi:hypothetical protein
VGELHPVPHTSFGESIRHAGDNQSTKRTLLSKSIETLQKNVSKEGVIHGDQAERFINRLVYLLKSISGQQNEHSTNLLKRGADTFCDYEDISPRELKRLRGVVTSSISVSLNTSCE